MNGNRLLLFPAIICVERAVANGRPPAFTIEDTRLAGNAIIDLIKTVSLASLILYCVKDGSHHVIVNVRIHLLVSFRVLRAVSR